MSDDKDPFGIKAFLEKVRNKDPEALALMDRVNAENAGRHAGYEAGKRDAFQKFPWPFVMLGGFVAWGAAGYWVLTQYPILLLPAIGTAAVWFTWTKAGWKPAAIVAVVVLAACGGVYYDEAAHAKPWSLWKRNWQQHMGDPEQSRLARFSTQDECIKAQWEQVDKEFRAQTQAYEMVKSMFPDQPKVFVQEGRTIFGLGPSMWSRLHGSKPGAPADLDGTKDLTEYQKKELAFRMSLPEIDSAVSVYCAPSLRYAWGPHYTPAYPAAADDLRGLGERTLAIRAKQMLGDSVDPRGPKGK